MANNLKSAAELRKLLADRKAEAEKKLGGGKLSAHARMALLFDEGTFVEVGAYIRRKTTELDISSGEEFEPVVTGYGAVDGTLVYAFSQDFSRLSGALGEAHAKKIADIYDMALRSEAPIVGVFDSAGAKILEPESRRERCFADPAFLLYQICTTFMCLKSAWILNKM